MRTTFALAICGLIFGLSSMTAVAAPPQSTLFPTAVGSKWIYEAGQYQLIEEISRTEMIDGELCIRIDTSINGKFAAHEHLAVRQDGIYRVSIAGERVTPPLCILKYPVRKGAQWEVASVVKDVKIAGQFVIGQETVTVPAGQFQAISVRGSQFESEDGALDFTYYFVPGMGKVKQVIATSGKSMELVLKEYQPAK